MEIRFQQLNDEDKAALYSYAGYLLSQENNKPEDSGEGK